jgi:hypothetical protein
MRRSLLIALALLAAPGCSAWRASGSGTDTKLKIVDIEVGRAIGADKRVTAPVGYFTPADTIYTSVVTDGKVSHATLSARWSRQGALLEETEQTIAPTGPAVSEFHVFNPAGWTPGDYRVEILLDGQVVGDRPFRVDPAAKSS